MNDDPLLPYLAEIIALPEAAGVILSGGFGLRLKQYHLRKRSEAEGRTITLIAEIPEARATQDLDLILNVKIWQELDQAHALSAVLKDRLHYETATHSWQYRKKLTGFESRYVKLDLQARKPLPDERVKVKGNPRQVGREMGTGISGLETPEAFAVHDGPILLPVPFSEPAGAVLVPHPYAWLHLKVRAAYDWLREQRGEAPEKLTQDGSRVRLKHVHDVYLLTAMMTLDERNEAITFATKYADHDEAGKTREQAIELYGNPAAPGLQAVQSYFRQSTGRVLEIEHDLFWEEGLKVALGI